MRYSRVWRIPAGYWTDDTSMALCLADSIIEHDAINHLDILERFCRWYQLGENSSTGRCFDIGNTTRQALEAWIRNGDKNGAPISIWESGNGSIMRLAPVAVIPSIRYFGQERTAALIRINPSESETTRPQDIGIQATAVDGIHMLVDAL